MLDNFDKSKKPFKVPENYFENFNNRIMDQLPSKEEPKAKIVPLWRKGLGQQLRQQLLVFCSQLVFLTKTICLRINNMPIRRRI